MGDLKPLGSEKLNNDEKLKRILELTYYKQNNKKSSNKPELVKEGKNNTVYGIIKEKDGYYVKKGLNEQTLDYIGGMFMKNKNRFSSYAEAFKRMEFLRGQDMLGEATKYVLKKNTEEAPVPTAPGTDDMVPTPSPEAGSDTPDLSGLEVPGEGAPAEMPTDTTSPDMAASPESVPTDEKPEGGESKRSDYMAEVQKYAGKLGQELRDQKERMESDDIKYVLNMIISAVDLDKLEAEDLEEIGKKFEPEEVEDSTEEIPTDELPTGEVPAEEPVAGEEEPVSEPSTEKELGEESFGGMSGLEEFIKSPVSTKEIDLSKYAMKEGDLQEKEKTVILDMDEIKKQIQQSVSEILGKHFKE